MDVNTDIDKVWKALGTWGRYQTFQLTYMMVTLVPVSFPLLVIVFIGYEPKHQCKTLTNPLFEYQQFNTSIEENITDYKIDYGKCNIDVIFNVTNTSTIHTSLPCFEGQQYDTEKDRTIVSEWDLVCTRTGLGELSQALVMVGQIVGGILFPALSDRYGRKAVFVSTHICLFIISVGMAFVQNYSAFAVLRLLIGMLQQGLDLSLSTLCLEIFPKECRGTIATIGSLVWSFSLVALTPFGYFLRHYSWRYIQLAVGLTSFYSILGYWILGESLRWLVVNNKQKEAIRLVKKAAKWNKVKEEEILPLLIFSHETTIGYPNKEIVELNQSVPGNETTSNQIDSLTGDEIQARTTRTGSNAHIQRYNLFSLLKNKLLLRTSLIMWYAWCVNSVTYYSLFLSSTNLSPNRYLSYFLNALVELPGAILFRLLINRIGRKHTSILFHAVAGLSLIISVVLVASNDGSGVIGTVSGAFTLVGKFGISVSFNTIFLYTPELYPTNLRNTAFGMASAVGRIGGIAAPYSNLLASHVSWAPGVIFGACCLLVIALTLILPETKGKELPQTMEEIIQWYKHSSRLKVKDKIIPSSKPHITLLNKDKTYE